MAVSLNLVAVSLLFNISRGGYYYTTVAAKVSDFGSNLLKCC